MLVNSKEVFRKAQEGHYAVPAANVLDMESIKNHISVAEKLGLPLIVGVAEGDPAAGRGVQPAVPGVTDALIRFVKHGDAVFFFMCQRRCLQ